jgi:hypothetical protein
MESDEADGVDVFTHEHSLDLFADHPAVMPFNSPLHAVD